MTTEFNIPMGTITVDGVRYDVETHSTDRGKRFTIMLGDEDVFDGLEGKVEYEEHIDENDNPRQDSNVGVMSVSYRGYDLGDEDISQEDFEIECPTCEGSGDSPHWIVGFHRTAEPLVTGSEDECQDWLDRRLDVLSGSYYIEPIGCSHCQGEGRIVANPADFFKKTRGARVVLPLIVYEHSGITMRCGHVGDIVGDSAGWDTSFVGYIFDTPEQIKECMGDDATDEQIEKALRGEVESYASYLEGDVSWWQVEDEETGFHESCGGYVGDNDYAESECFSNLADALAKRIAEEAERAYWLEREVVTV
jgi:hypothetical protein